MRARPEPTLLEDLSDASFLSKLLLLPANVTLDWKVFARYKHSSLFGLVISNECFYDIDTRTLLKKLTVKLVSDCLSISLIARFFTKAGHNVTKLFTVVI